MPVPGLSGAGCVWLLCVLLPASARPVEEVLGQFLQALNWTDQGPRPRPRSEPPEYMLELYNRFNDERSTAPAASIVRSFRNQDRSSPRLQFNISVPPQERVVSAELRLHVLLKTDSRQRSGAGWKLSVFDARCHRRPLASKLMHRRESGWEALDMTSAVQRWREAGALSPVLELRLETLQPFRNTAAAPDIDRNPDGKHEPALIVFSDDSSEIRKEENRSWPDETRLTSNAIQDGGSRVRRAAKTEDCRKAEMYVDFKDIGWDSFVLAPAGYQAFTCRGACNYPLAPEITPTRHAIVQTLLNLKSPQRAAQACCVPTELKPISLLYENKNGVVVLDNKYEGMVVKECGCR